jgi:hypothetical protein
MKSYKLSVVINYVYRLTSDIMFESVLFSRDTKTSFCYVVTCAAIAVCRTTTVDGLWRVADCVSSHTPRVGEERRTVCEVITLTGTMQSQPLLWL